MPGKDNGAAQPALDTGGSHGGIADVSRRDRGAGGASKPLSGAHSQERGGLIALGNQILGGAVDQHEAGTRGRPFQPPTILRAPSSLLSRPLFLHPFPPFRAASLPPPVAAPLLFLPPAQSPRPAAPADSTAASTQTPDAPQPADVQSPKVELGVTASEIATAPTSVETPSSSRTVSAAASSDSATASITSASAPDMAPLAFATGKPVSASLIDSSFTNPGTSDILPVTTTGVGVGGKVAAACVIGAVFLLLLNWAFWLVIRRRRRARRSMPAHWDFAAPPPAKGDAGRDSEEDERDAKGGMVAVPV